MDLILDQLEEKNYYLNIREFASGAFEAVMKVVKPLSQEQIDAGINGTSYAAACAEKGETSRSGFTSFGYSKSDEDINEFDRAKNHSRAVRRAKQNIRWLCKVMQADRLFTLTYRENVEDRELVRAQFKDFLRRVRERFPDWAYVAVLEKQDRGAFHIHCAVRGFQHLGFLRACWHKALGAEGVQLGESSPGNVNVTSPQEKRWGAVSREWKTERLAGYITKYLAKTFDESSTEKRRYWHARDLKVPAKQRLWIGGSNIFDAIKSCLNTLEFHCGLEGVDFDWWLSTQNDCLWIAGKGD